MAAFDGVDPPARELLDDCVHCGFCLPVCPTYVSWREEMDSPRGRIDLMRGLAEGRIEWSDTVARHFDRCLGCMACVTACPSGVKYDVLIEETRAKLEHAHRRPLGERLFRLHAQPLPLERRRQVASDVLHERHLHRREAAAVLHPRGQVPGARPARLQRDARDAGTADVLEAFDDVTDALVGGRAHARRGHRALALGAEMDDDAPVDDPRDQEPHHTRRGGVGLVARRKRGEIGEHVGER